MNEFLQTFSLNEIVSQLVTWFLEEVFVISHFVQVTSILVAGLLAFFIYRKTSDALHGFANRAGASRVVRILANAVLDIAFPLYWLLLLIVVLVAYEFLQQSHIIISTAMSLITAWAIIRLGSRLIDNAFVSKAVATVVWIIAALQIMGVLEQTVSYLEAAQFKAGALEISAFDVISSLLSIGLFLWIALFLIKIFDSRIQESHSLSPSLRVLASKLFKFLVIAVAVLGGVSAVGIDLTALAVFSGAVGVGIGFGLQKIFSNLIAGVILLMDRSIKPGDTIFVDGSYGKVDTLGARYVSVITRDAVEYLIPNEELIINQVQNWSYSHKRVRFSIPIGVHYKTEVRKAMGLCIQAASCVDRVLKDPSPVCLLKGFGDNSVDLELRFWVNDPMKGRSNVISQILLEVWDRFIEHEIEIPYPQRDLHLRSVDESVSLVKNNPAS